MSKLIKELGIGFAVLIVAVMAFLLIMQLAGTGVFEFGQLVRDQGNRWLLPVRLGVYIWAVWYLPMQSGQSGAQLKQTRLVLGAAAVLIELVAVQQLFLF